MKTRKELNDELRRRILDLPGVTERPETGIHEDAFFVGRTMFMHIHGLGHCDIRLAKQHQEQVLASGQARPHRWAPEAGYVTFKVNAVDDLDPAMALIWMSHAYFSGDQKPLTADGRATHLLRNESGLVNPNLRNWPRR